VLGHIFPVFLKFKGGKGFASFLGMTLALNWKFALIVLVLVVLITVITDYLVAATLTTVIIVPIYMGIAQQSVCLPLVLLIATAVIFYRHRENIPRMLNGTEIGLRSTLKKKTKV
jgi:glycerol-3-phosphate acyltransferase PlsY